MLRYKMKLVACIVVAYMMTTCSAAKKSNSPIESSDELKPYVLKFERGPCFGQCPVYSFYILKDHTALVNSKAHLMDSAGWYFANPDQESIVEILELIEPEEWWRNDLRDQPEIADLPSSTLTYYHPEGVRSLTIKSRTTHAYENVFGKISHLVSDCRWKSTQLRPIETANKEPLHVIVQLKEEVDIYTWMKKFDRFGIELVRKVAPRQSYYVVSKDPNKGNANDFLQYIKNDTDVVGAQWDKEIQIREE